MVLMALAARDDRVVAPVVVRSRPATVRGGPLHPESNGDPVRSTALPLGDGGASKFSPSEGGILNTLRAAPDLARAV